MNPMDIINGLGGIEDGFVMEAAAFRREMAFSFSDPAL